MGRRNQIHPPSASGKTKLIQSAAPSTRGELNGYALRSILRGKNTIPDQIVDNRQPYFNALEQADDGWRKGAIDLSKMEDLLENMLAVQLKSMMEQATQKNYDAE